MADFNPGISMDNYAQLRGPDRRLEPGLQAFEQGMNTIQGFMLAAAPLLEKLPKEPKVASLQGTYDLPAKKQAQNNPLVPETNVLVPKETLA